MTDLKSISVIDESQFEQLMMLDEGSFELINELLEIWNTTASEVYSEVEKAIESNDFNSIEKLSHKMKGSCSNISFGRLAQTWAQIESAAKDCSKDKVRTLYELSKGFYEESKIAMEKRSTKTAA